MRPTTKVLKICPNCQKEFLSYKYRKFCSCHCNAQFYRAFRNIGFKKGHFSVGGFKKGHVPWTFGLTKETDKRIDGAALKGAETQRVMYANGEKTPWNKGLTKETDERVAQVGIKLSQFRTGQNNLDKYEIRICPICEAEFTAFYKSDKKYCSRRCCYQSKIGHPCWNMGRGKSGYRKDLGHLCRSTWEANFARILKYLGIPYEYEPKDKRVRFSHCSYLPDFYLPDLNLFVEVKGWYRDEKLELLYKENPDFPIKIVDDEVYRILSQKYSKLIPNWERYVNQKRI